MANYIFVVFLFLLDIIIVLGLIRFFQAARVRHSVWVDLVLVIGGLCHVFVVSYADQKLAMVPYIQVVSWIQLAAYLLIYLASVLMAYHYGDRSELLIQVATQLTLLYIGVSCITNHNIHLAAPILLLLVLVYRYLQRDCSREKHS